MLLHCSQCEPTVVRVRRIIYTIDSQRQQHVEEEDEQRRVEQRVLQRARHE